MKKAFKIAVILLAALAVLSGCTVTKTKEISVNYNVTTGDEIKMTLNQIGGYKMNMKTPFIISKDGTEILNGSFITKEGYDYYYDMVKNQDSDATVLDEGTKDGNAYLMYTVVSENAQEYDYIVLVHDSQTAVLMGSLESEEEAKACFEAVKFERVK